LLRNEKLTVTVSPGSMALLVGAQLSASKVIDSTLIVASFVPRNPDKQQLRDWSGWHNGGIRRARVAWVLNQVGDKQIRRVLVERGQDRVERRASEQIILNLEVLDRVAAGQVEVVRNS